MQLALEGLIERALEAPVTAIAYLLSKEIAKLSQGKGLLETSTWAFDLEDFSSHGQCEVTTVTSPHPMVARSWVGRGEDEDSDELEQSVEIGLQRVRWQEVELEVLRVEWPSSCGTETRNWIFAHDQPTVESFFNAVCGFCATPHDEVYVFEEGCWDKSEELFHAIQGVSLETLVLAPGLKEELLRDVAAFFASEATYKKHGVPWKRGLLLTGPPGNGKTHAIKGLINATGVSCLYARSFSCENVSDQRNIREVFRRARSSAPCLLVLEDLDSLITDTNRSFFLNEMDGFAENHGLMVLATTNHPERLDPAIVERPSRFDRKYLFALPALTERASYLERWNTHLHPDLRANPVVVKKAAEQTEGFSFAYLKELTLSATMRWTEEQRPGTMDQILSATTQLLRQQIQTDS